MKMINALEDFKATEAEGSTAALREGFGILLRCLYPATPHIAHALWNELGYAAEQGVPVACVTDGNTWLFFKASRTDGKKPMDGKGVLFTDLTSVIANMGKFTELLGRGPIVERLHLAHLNDAEGLRIPDAEQQLYVLDPADARMRKRDELASDAALLFSQFFSRMSDEKDREMLRDCFVEMRAPGHGDR